MEIKTEKQIKKQKYNKAHLDRCKNIQEDGSFKKYELGKIYAIKSKNSPLVYIGSTYRPSTYRFSIHKYNYNKYLQDNTRPYQTPFDVLKYGDCHIEILESCNCSTRKQLEEREKHFIHMYSAICVNRNNLPKIVPEHKKIMDEIKENNKQIKELENMIKIAQEFLVQTRKINKL